MKILITGAAGFIGLALAHRLLENGVPGFNGGQTPVESLVLSARRFDDQAIARDARVSLVLGDIRDPQLVRQVVGDGVDLVFHFASVTSRKAEDDIDTAREVNVDATITLLDTLRALKRPPLFVFASSIGVFGGPLPEVVDDDTPQNPSMSYGIQKKIGELLVADYHRRGWIDGRTVRVPGIIVRPEEPVAALSAFTSAMIRELSAGRRFIAPVSAAATVSLMSIERCVDNFLCAATSPTDLWPVSRVVNLPALTVPMGELAAAVSEATGVPLSELLSYAPQERIEALIGRSPSIVSRYAEKLKLSHDGTVQSLVAAALREHLASQKRTLDDGSRQKVA